MPVLTIEVSEQQEAKIVQAIADGNSFSIDCDDSTTVENGEGVKRRVKTIAINLGEIVE
jgi:hypothetical protein